MEWMMINFRHLTGEQYVPLGLRRQEWCFSVQDVVTVPTESNAPKQYIKKMRSRDSELSANWGTNCTPVQMKAAVGKLCKVQAANIEGILRIPSRFMRKNVCRLRLSEVSRQ